MHDFALPPPRPGGFRALHGTGRPGAKVHVPAPGGSWRCVYNEEGDLVEVAHARRKGARATGLRLYLDPVNGSVAFKTPTGLAGLQWTAGRVAYGTVWDDDAPGPAEAIDLDDWIDDCLATMAGDGGRPEGPG